MKKQRVKALIVLLASIGVMGMFAGCSSDDDYKETLNNGIEKYNTGEKMTEDEYNAVKRYNNWKDKQGEKSYDDWDK